MGDIFTLKTTGNFDQTRAWLLKLSQSNANVLALMNAAGAKGVQALAAATPTRTGVTASSWSYQVLSLSNGYKLVFTNSHVNEGSNIAILIQYGHGTGTGGYVQGRDYINPIIRPLFDQLASDLLKAVTTR